MGKKVFYIILSFYIIIALGAIWAGIFMIDRYIGPKCSIDYNEAKFEHIKLSESETDIDKENNEKDTNEEDTEEVSRLNRIIESQAREIDDLKEQINNIESNKLDEMLSTSGQSLISINNQLDKLNQDALYLKSLVDQVQPGFNADTVIQDITQLNNLIQAYNLYMNNITNNMENTVEYNECN